jgi:hypothetical protein
MAVTGSGLSWFEEEANHDKVATPKGHSLIKDE